MITSEDAVFVCLFVFLFVLTIFNDGACMKFKALNDGIIVCILCFVSFIGHQTTLEWKLFTQMQQTPTHNTICYVPKDYSDVLHHKCN